MFVMYCNSLTIPHFQFSCNLKDLDEKVTSNFAAN